MAESGLNGLKRRVIKRVEQQRRRLVELSLKIHDTPEVGFKEEKARRWLTHYLKGRGFEIVDGVGNLSTAFKAVYGSGGPVIAMLAEYDALPGIGHACGHNIIAASAVGAAVASRLAADRYGGTIMVIGTPAEELFGGKVAMLRAGAFDGIDAAMMVHPGVRNVVAIEALACAGLDIEFFGRAAHAATYPEEGINALEGMIQAFNAVNSLRQHIRDRARIHGIIKHGGEAANVVPSYTAGQFLVRALDDSYLDQLKQKVLDCFVGASIATGARLEYRWAETSYSAMKNNLPLAQLFFRNLQLLGRKLEPFEKRYGFGSTDMGNVSQVIPAIHPTIAIAGPDISLHSADFARAAASARGHEGLVDAAKALAMTVVDLISEPVRLAEVKSAFRGRE